MSSPTIRSDGKTNDGANSGSTILPSGTHSVDASLPNMPQLSGEFAILRKLGEGSYGQVYLATQISLGRLVALKITSGDSGGRNEGQLLAGLEHDHIVKVFSEFADPASQTLCLCLQYIPGMNLGGVIKHLHAAHEAAGLWESAPRRVGCQCVRRSRFRPRGSPRPRRTRGGELSAVGLPARRAAGGSARVRPRQGDSPLRHQAGEHPADAVWPAAPGGLQRRLRSGPPSAQRRHRRDLRLHGPRTHGRHSGTAGRPGR